MNDKHPKGLFRFLNYEERKAAEGDVRQQYAELYNAADDLRDQTENFELLSCDAR